MARPSAAKMAKALSATLPCVLALSAAWGCASEVQHRRHRVEEQDVPTAAPRAPLGPWPHFGELSQFKEVAYASHSAHRLGEDAATILKNDAANATLTAAQPSGAILVAGLSTGRDAPANEYFVMERGEDGQADTSAGWSFVVVGADGQMKARGALPLCVRCHEEAGPGLVFGLKGP